MKTSGLVATAALVGLLVPTVAAARLGETIGECDARYGKPTHVEAGAVFANSLERTYVKNGFTIKVVFVEGRAETISYSHPSTFAGEPVTKLLNNNARGEVWAETPNGSSTVYGSWETPHGARAEYFKPKPWESPSAQYCLKITSSTFRHLVKGNDTEKKDQEHKKAEAAQQRAEAAKQREEQEQRERSKLLDKL